MNSILILLLLSADFLALYLSLSVSQYVYGETVDVSLYMWIFSLILLVFATQKIYILRYDFWGDTKRVLKSLLFSFFAAFTVISLAKISQNYSASLLFGFFITAAFLTLIIKRIFKQILFSLDVFKIKIKVVADKENYETLCDEIEDNWYFGYKSVDEDYDMVLISSKGLELGELQENIKEFSKNTKDIFVIPYLDYLNFSHTTIVDFSNIRVSAFHIENRLLNYKNMFIKSFFEKIVVVLLFPFALLAHIFIRTLIKMDSKGEVIFKQQRLAKDSKSFECYKYRTMYENSDDILKEYLSKNPDEAEYFKKYHKYKSDPRITRVGSFLRKTSLDELPQFYNILKGDMNLIGPRPYMLSELKDIGENNEDIILKVKPGITGLWQVSGRNKLTFEKRVELDVWYIQNWSLWMDFVIFIKTIKVVLLKVGAK